MKNLVKSYFEKGATIITMIALFVFAAVVFDTIQLQGPLGISALYGPAITALTNNEREEAGASVLQVNPLLQKAAQMKADDMAKRGYFAHISPDGQSPWYWFNQVGYNYLYAGENLAVNFTDSEKVNNAWMNSPLHRKNILDKRFTEIGIATAKGYFNGKETLFVVQMFGAPKASSGSVQPVYASTNQTSALLLSNPQKILHNVYFILGIIILLALITYIGDEWRKHHMRHAVIGTIVLALLLIGVWLYELLFAGNIFIS